MRMQWRPFLDVLLCCEQDTRRLRPHIDELRTRDGRVELVVKERTLQQSSRARIPQIDAVACVEVRGRAEYNVELRVVCEAEPVSVLSPLTGDVEAQIRRASVESGLVWWSIVARTGPARLRTPAQII